MLVSVLICSKNIVIFLLNWQEGDRPLIPPTIPLSSEHVSDDGIYLLENGDDGLIYIGNSVNPDIMRQLFGISSVDVIPSQVVYFIYLFLFFFEVIVGQILLIIV